MNHDFEQAVLTIKDFLTLLPRSSLRDELLSQPDDMSHKLGKGNCRDILAKLAITIMADLYDPKSSDKENQQRIATAFEAVADEFFHRSAEIRKLNKPIPTVLSDIAEYRAC